MEAKQTPKIDVQKTVEILGLALVAIRESLAAQSEALKLHVLTVRFAETLQRNVDLLDFSTSALAAELGGSRFPGAGGTPSQELLARAETWIHRGKQDSLIKE
jgi:hypothetical protein